jgi:hypothetical protein
MIARTACMYSLLLQRLLLYCALLALVVRAVAPEVMASLRNAARLVCAGIGAAAVCQQGVCRPQSVLFTRC